MMATAICSQGDGSQDAESIYCSIKDSVHDLWSDLGLPGQLSGPWCNNHDAKAKLIPFVRQVLRKALRQQNRTWECDLDFDKDHMPDGLLLANSFGAKRVEIELKRLSIRIGGVWLPLDLAASGDQIVRAIAEQAARFFSRAPSTEQSPFLTPSPSARRSRF